MLTLEPRTTVRTTIQKNPRKYEVELKEKIIVVTGGASGGGREMCRRFTREGAAKVVVADLNGDGAKAVAQEIGSVGHAVDVRNEQDIINLIEDTEDKFGPIDLFCSNAGIGIGRDVSDSDEVWQAIWEVNTMSHVWATRHGASHDRSRWRLFAQYRIRRRSLESDWFGNLCRYQTRRCCLGGVAFHAYGDRGIKVSVLCPQAVRTAMTANGPGVAGIDGMIEPEDAVSAVVDAVREERFLVLPHPEVAEYMQRKTADYDRWLKGMRRLQGLYHKAKDPDGRALTSTRCSR